MAPNALINEKSPYLIQHARNPVDWQPWGDVAFARARAENKPVFLSIGYATCHWCHVMEKESFEDVTAAGYLNDTFVCIKVDREERPDIDTLYMTACQFLTGSGGWPLNILMTPERKPFYTATYIPKNSGFGRPGLIDICQVIKKQWRNQRGTLAATAEKIMGHLETAFDFIRGPEPDETLLEEAFEQIGNTFDTQWGGFEPAPKFPSPHRLLFLLRRHRRTGSPEALKMVQGTLTAMRLGGIWDHVGFGFHRYATDTQWLLPHFEKMLYDQALLAAAYMAAFQATGEPLFGRTAQEIFEYVLRDMTDSGGGFYSAEDADSEGEEGKFHVWPLEEFRSALSGMDTEPWEKIFHMSAEGNFLDEATRRRTGANILHLTEPLSYWAEKTGMAPDTLEDQWQVVRGRLFTAREKRIHPLKDDKVLTDWNGMMIGALADGARLFGRSDYEHAARKAASFILNNMRRENGELYHRFRDGEPAIAATASDYAFLVYGLLKLRRATGDATFAKTAEDLQKEMISAYWDEKNGGFFLTSRHSTDLPVRPKELYDGAMPSANSVSLENLLLLFRITGDVRWKEKAGAVIQAFAGTVTAQPAAFTYFLYGLDMAIGSEPPDANLTSER